MSISKVETERWDEQVHMEASKRYGKYLIDSLIDHVRKTEQMDNKIDMTFVFLNLFMSSAQILDHLGLDTDHLKQGVELAIEQCGKHECEGHSCNLH